MLLELRLRNFAIAEDVSLALAPGLNVLTGSTGAGKSLVVEALRWLSGARVDKGMVRRGTEVASVEALFDVSDRDSARRLLLDLGLEWPEDGLLRLRREVRAASPSRAFVGASRTTASVLTALCDGLIELQSQHRQLALLHPPAHVQLLDACGVADDLCDEYRGCRREFANAQARLRAWRERMDRVSEQRDFLQMQVKELDDARLLSGEMATLKEKVARLAGGAQLLSALSTASSALSDDDKGALAALHRAVHHLESAPEGIDGVGEALELLRSALALAADADREVASLLSDDILDEASLEESQSRLAQLESLCRRYGRTEEELLAFHARVREELGQLDGADGPPPDIMVPWERARERLERGGAALERARRKVARRVAREAGPLLEDLGMPGAEIEFQISPRVDPESDVAMSGQKVDPGPTGFTDVRLRVRTNPGEASGPVERVASGGELSRIGLTLKTLGLSDLPALIILDEIDAGLGADLGPAIARRLVAMSGGTQTLVISHLPHVAAAAGLHLRATKGERSGRTVATIETLLAPARVEELARMIGGESREARRLAKHLLDGAVSAVAGEGA